MEESQQTQATALFQRALDHNAYLYYELAYTRQTGWMCWFQNREGGGKVNLETGQSEDPEEACRPVVEAIKKYLAERE